MKEKGSILVSEVDVPAEELSAGPRGYRVHVIDFDTESEILYRPAVLKPVANGQYEYLFALRKDATGAVKGRRSQAYDKTASVRPAVPRAERLRDRDAHVGPLRIRIGAPGSLGKRWPSNPCRAACVRRRERLLFA